MSNYSNRKIATFQERFAQLCDENSGSLTRLAEALHVSKQTVSAWRLGTRSPKQPTIVAISDYFNINIEWLMGFDVERNRKKKERPIIIPDSITFRKIAEEMSPNDYEMIMEVFERTYKRMQEEGKA